MFREKDELVVVEGEPVWWDNELVTALDREEKTRGVRVNLGVKKYLPTVLLFLALAVWTAVVWGVSYCVFKANTEKRLSAEYDRRVLEYTEEQERAAQYAMDTDPYTLQLNAEAEMLARVLYGVRDNSSDDLKTYCWCVFNRVDNAAYPSDLEDVIAQPGQWMRYDVTNPILEDLYQIAREQLNGWHTNTHRPCGNEFVFMNWTPSDICLRDNFHEGSGTHYWRYK